MQSTAEICCEARCPLNRIKAGLIVRIKKLCTNEQTAQRLREIGLGEEQLIRLLTCHTNIICQVCSARLAISHQLAETILVEPVPFRACGTAA
jgi:Fe2+ transport system protein FeoA